MLVSLASFAFSKPVSNDSDHSWPPSCLSNTTQSLIINDCLNELKRILQETLKYLNNDEIVYVVNVVRVGNSKHVAEDPRKYHSEG